MTEQEHHLLALYACIQSAMELSEAIIMQQQNARGDAEIQAIVHAISEDVGLWWTAFRKKWGIPDHPFSAEIIEQSRKNLEGS